jgi:hypothetical protein
VGGILWGINYWSDRVRKHPVSLRTNLLILFCAFWFLATFSAWHDADKNLTLVEQQRAVDTSKLASCTSDLTAKSGLVELYQSQLTAQQTMFNSVQGTLSECVNGSLEKVRAKVDRPMIFARGIDPDPKRSPYFQSLLLMSSQVVAVDFRLHCEREISDVVAGLLNTSTMMSGRGGGRRSKYDWDISIGAPSLSPVTPLAIIVYYTALPPRDSKCTIFPN